MLDAAHKSLTPADAAHRDAANRKWDTHLLENGDTVLISSLSAHLDPATPSRFSLQHTFKAFFRALSWPRSKSGVSLSGTNETDFKETQLARKETK